MFVKGSDMHTIGHIHHGPAWKTGVPVTAQGLPMEKHLKYMKELFDREALILGGPYDAGHGGVAVFVTETLAEAQRLADEDPAHQAGVIGYRLEVLRPVFDAAADLDSSERLAGVMASSVQPVATEGSRG